MYRYRDMKAIRIHQLGGPEVLQYEEVPDPVPSAGTAVVALQVAGVNFIDTYHRQGLYKVDLPFTPGIEGAGTVLSVGPGVSDVKPGDRVAYCMSLGSYAEQAVVEAWKLVPLPEGIDFATGAALMVQGLTAHYLTYSTYPVQPGDTVLVHAAAGGVGLLLIQVAKARGARVLGTVSTPAKAELAYEAGAEEVIFYTEKDFEEEVRRLTGGEGVAVVYESVGKATFDKSLNCLRTRGYLVLFGQSSGPVPPLDPQILNAKGSLFLTRPSLFHYAASRPELMGRAQDLFAMIQEGKLRVKIGHTFPLAEAATAHQALEGRKTTGKVLLQP